MMVFWVVVACFVIAALLFVLPPLLKPVSISTRQSRSALNVSVYRDQIVELEQDLRNDTITAEQYEIGRKELERRLLEDVAVNETSVEPAKKMASRNTAIVVGVAVPLFAVFLYTQLGKPALLNPPAQIAQTGNQGAAPDGKQHSDVGAQIEAMVAGLEQRLASNPDDMEGWLMLARSYRFLKRHADAVKAFERSMPMVEQNAQMLADYADTLAMATGGALEGKPMQLIQKALVLEPTNQQALWLAGTSALESKNYAEALGYWRRLQAQTAPGSKDAQIMAANIAEAEALAGGNVPPAAALPESSPTANAGGVVSGIASLAPALANKISPNDTLFIFARAAQGPKIPLAILKLQAKDLPVSFSLNDTMAMMPDMALSNFPEVVVGARISKSGNAMPQSGDLEGLTPIVKVGSDGLHITIDRTVP